ncbi:MAG: hypothetical protein BEU04_04555 [Marine Group III euryarchaeote CG-Bathy1]|uniref:DUF106 domain-containing protein n=1 Tax=Marine Group III euryarchaeote CG-Bathy1 TaxID=1889001 RepID=A0A1J5U2K5_9ARCH|nr:MAG: hypothetical protein BEU04_04555 [Marine Group III euryarchaeote CG-Bathy1]
MSEKGSSTEEVQPPAMGGMLITMLFMIYIMINPSMREGMGNIAGSILEPYIGFNGDYPILTIFAAGLIMICSNTIVRHFLIDWNLAAEIQAKMAEYNKALREARSSNQEGRLRKLMQMQPKVMSMQGEMMSNQMRPMGFTMIVAIPIIMWMYQFIENLTLPELSLPWNPRWDLIEKWWFLPHWILIYSLLAIPFGQALQRGLKIMGNWNEIKKLSDESPSLDSELLE